VGLASSDIEGKRYHAPFVAIKLLSGLISTLGRNGSPKIATIVAGIAAQRAGGMLGRGGSGVVSQTNIDRVSVLG